MKNTCQVPPVSKPRIYLRAFLSLVVNVVALLLLFHAFPRLGIIKDLSHTIWLIFVLAGIEIIIWPLLLKGFLYLFHKISPVFMLVAFPLIPLIVPAILLMLADWLSPGLTIFGFGSALLISLYLAFISLVFSSIFATDDESIIFHWIFKRNNSPVLAANDMSKPGIIFLEIDGLGGKVLTDAMAIGKVPNMKRWLDCGSHKLVTWESDLSSQTSSAQAGILHGKNFGIPAFRWYDKAKKEMIVSSSIKDVSELEKQLSDGKGLLSNGGAARASLFSGDATRVLMTASRVLDVTSADLRAYYLNPSNLLKTCFLMVWDWGLEKRAAWSQYLRNEKPRINRGGIYFILRSIMTVLLRDFSLFTLKGDMYSGVPYVYATLAGYDEVSHHSGVKRADALEILRKLDREFGRLGKIARVSPRNYHLVVLSDHGHTQGATFFHRYQERLEDVVGRLIHTSRKDYRIAGYRTHHESAYYIEAAFHDYKFSESRTGKRLRNTLVRNQQFKIGENEQDDVVVLASGNMGLIYFPGIERRVSYEELLQDFPGLLEGLVEHPGIGFITVHSDKKGTIALGKQGTIFLTSGKIEGDNPLIDYGPLALPNLARATSFPNAPDILVMSSYWKETDEVAAFEELVSSHGGMGGEQSRPFILFPAGFDLGTNEIAGAEAVYKIFKRWTNEVNS